jgi:hypothetical protein
MESGGDAGSPCIPAGNELPPLGVEMRMSPWSGKHQELLLSYAVRMDVGLGTTLKDTTERHPQDCHDKKPLGPRYEPETCRTWRWEISIKITKNKILGRTHRLLYLIWYGLHRKRKSKGKHTGTQMARNLTTKRGTHRYKQQADVISLEI